MVRVVWWRRVAWRVVVRGGRGLVVGRRGVVVGLVVGGCGVVLWLEGVGVC